MDALTREIGRSHSQWYYATVKAYQRWTRILAPLDFLYTGDLRCPVARLRRMYRKPRNPLLVFQCILIEPTTDEL